MQIVTDAQYTPVERLVLATLSDEQQRLFDIVRNQGMCVTLRMRAAKHLPDDALSVIDNSVARRELRERGIVA